MCFILLNRKKRAFKLEVLSVLLDIYCSSFYKESYNNINKQSFQQIYRKADSEY